MVRVAMQATSQLIANVASEISEGNSVVSRQSRCFYKEIAIQKVQERHLLGDAISLFLKDETGLEVLNPGNLTLPTLLKPSMNDFIFFYQVMC